MQPLETFAWGFLGSTAVELVTLLGFYSSRAGRLPERYRKVGFWITRFVLALLAGLLAVAYDIDQRILAFNVGAATPLIITLMTKGIRRTSLPPETSRRPHPPRTAPAPPADKDADRGAVGSPRKGRTSGPI